MNIFCPPPPSLSACCRQRKKDLEMQETMHKKFREAVLSNDIHETFRDVEKAQVCFFFCASWPAPVARRLVESNS